MWPLQLAVENESSPNRIGGRAPEGLIPKYPESRYLMTVPLEDDTYVSIFLLKEGEYCIQNNLYISAEGDMIEVFFHEYLPRRKDDSFFNELTGFALEIKPEQVDELELKDDIKIPSSENKLGGEAFILGSGGVRRSLVAQLKAEGFEQFLQLDAIALGPHPFRFTAGEWPFGDAMFHLYLKPPLCREWRCFWEL